MSNWAVEFKYSEDKLVAKYGDIHGHYTGIDTRYFDKLKKSEVDYQLRHIMKDGDCIDIIRIVNANKYQEELKEKSYCEYRKVYDDYKGECTLTKKDCSIGIKKGAKYWCPFSKEVKNMKLLIDIPEDRYRQIKDLSNAFNSDICQAIRNGKPYEAEINKIKSAISEVDFDFGDYYDHTDEIIAKIISKIDEVVRK